MAGVRRIGRFVVEAEAAEGAAGTVYLARDPGSNARVAVKLIRGLGAAEGVRFAREARILAQIEHPAVVRYVDHGHTEDGHAFLAMEWLEGEDARARLARAGFSIHESVVLGLRVAEALVEVHGRGLVHRDVKPANIFLPGGLVAEAKIIDFGLVHAAWASADLTATGMVLGTPSYMAPEQARGQRDVDARTDVFSLGCVLYKCLTGHAPFEGASVLAVLTKVLLEEAPPVRARRPEVPPALEALVMRMLHKDRDRRPATAAQVARELLALGPLDFLDEVAGPGAPSGFASGLTAGEQRVAAVLLVGAGAGVPGIALGPEDATLPSGLRLAPDADPRPIVEEHGGQLDLLLDGTRVVTLAAAGVATDQAARAARCALALRALLPLAPMAIATGRGEVGPHKPTGDAIDDGGSARRSAELRPQTPGERAATLLAGSAALAAGREGPPIAVDDVTAALLDPRFQVRRSADGLALVGMRAVDTPARTLLGRATIMVGREWELASIESLFRTCVDEREARPVLVTGPAGMGKSRLAHEAVGALRRLLPELTVWWARADPLRAGSALGLLGDVIRDAASVREGGDRHRFAERVAGWVPERDAAWIAEVLGEVAGVPFPDAASPALRAARQDPRIMSEQVRAAWEAIVAGAHAPFPLLVVLEDLQWADAATVRLVGGALAALEAIPGHRPWLVLALARPEVHEAFPRLWEGRNVQQIRLAPLTRRASERLAGSALGADADADTLARIAAQADGNAFYLEELIRAVADGRSADGALPETVLAMVQARLGALPAPTRRLLRAASIYGEVFWEGGVVALLGDSEPGASWVDLLIQRELVAPRAGSRFAGERELVFRHALLREGAYATLTEGDRALGNALAGTWLERHGETDAMVLAQHFALAHDDARAAHFYRAAAAQALRAADVDGAITRAEQALAQAPSEATRLECLSLLCEAHAWRDDWPRAASYASQVTSLAPRGSAPWIQAMGYQQTAGLTLGRIDELIGAIDALTTVQPAAGTAAVLVPALGVTVFLLCFGAQLATAAALLARLVTIVDQAGDDEPLTRAPLELARSWVAAWVDGDAWAALAHARAASARGAETHDARHARLSVIFTATSRMSLGLLAEAEAGLRSLGPVDGEDLLATVGALYLALVLIERGQLDEARALAQRRVEAGEARVAADGGLRLAEGRWLLGEVEARAGATAAAERELAAAVEGLRVSPLVWQLAAARLVEVQLALGRVAEALALARELAAAHEASGGHGLRGTLVRLVCAEALAAAGEHESARAALRAAGEDLEARAARIEDVEVRRRFLEDVPENARVRALMG